MTKDQEVGKRPIREKSPKALGQGLKERQRKVMVKQKSFNM